MVEKTKPSKDETKSNDQISIEQIETNVDYKDLYEKEPTIKYIVTNLKSEINNFAENLKGNILELAAKLKELNLCKTDEISRAIKEILKEEIQHNKISVKWIEECLPAEYKRKYEKRKEVSSLSKKKKEIPLAVTDNSGNSFAVTQEENISTNSSEKKDPFYYHNDKGDPSEVDSLNSKLTRENKELKEALEKATTFQSANNLIKEVQFPKEKYNELQTAVNECNAFVFIRFNAKGIVESIEPDTVREPQFENINDISNDDYTY